MKKIMSIFLVLSIIILSGCSNNSDALKFKEEYESLNGTTNSNNKEYRTVSISSNNPYKYTTTSKIIEMINNKETFFVYFGDKQCPWCRSVIEKSIEVASIYNIETIYYINIWDDDHNEILRDKYKIDEDNNLVEVSKGTDDYYTLLEIFDSLLDDYTLTDNDGNKVSVGEKRIYAPYFIYVENGIPTKLVEGTSSLQTDAFLELSSEILEDEEEIFSNFFNVNYTCTENC